MANPKVRVPLRQNQSWRKPVEALRSVAPRVDIFQTNREYLVLADLPGVFAETLRVAVDPPRLLIEGQRRVDGGHSVPFLRTLVLDERIDPESITAQVKYDILRVRLDKSAGRARRIELRSAA